MFAKATMNMETEKEFQFDESASVVAKILNFTYHLEQAAHNGPLLPSVSAIVLIMAVSAITQLWHGDIMYNVPDQKLCGNIYIYI